MSLLPVQLGIALGTILKLDKSEPFELSPASATICLSQPREFANSAAHGDYFDFRNVPDDFKKHSDP
jgi:hypothetical protein